MPLPRAPTHGQGTAGDSFCLVEWQRHALGSSTCLKYVYVLEYTWNLHMLHLCTCRARPPTAKELQVAHILCVCTEVPCFKCKYLIYFMILLPHAPTMARELQVAHILQFVSVFDVFQESSAAHARPRSGSCRWHTFFEHVLVVICF